MRHYNQWELGEFLKKKRRYMSAKEIAKETKTTLTTVNRKLNRLTKSRHIKKKVKRIQIGKCNHKIPVSFYRWKS
jgi:predicted transcriptional regulator